MLSNQKEIEKKEIEAENDRIRKHALTVQNISPNVVLNEFGQLPEEEGQEEQLENSRIIEHALGKSTASQSVVLNQFGIFSQKEREQQAQAEKDELSKHMKELNDQRKERLEKIREEKKKEQEYNLKSNAPYDMHAHIKELVDDMSSKNDNTKVAPATEDPIKALLNATPEEMIQQHKTTFKM